MRRSIPLPVLVISLLAASIGPHARGAEPLPRQKPEAQGLSAARLARIGARLNDDVARGQIPGAVVAIARRGKLVYFEAFGYLDKTAGTPMPKDAIFSVASMTKPMVGVATMMLVEAGQLHLGDPVSRYLPVLANLRVAVAASGGSAAPIPGAGAGAGAAWPPLPPYPRATRSRSKICCGTPRG